MKSAIKILTGLALLGLILATAGPLLAQERVVVEEREAVVVKKVGNTIIIRNDKNELKQYSRIPAGAVLYVDGKPAKIEDLRVGMKLHALRFQDVPPAVIVTEAQVAAMPPSDPEPAPAPAAAPAPAPAPAAAAPAPAATPAPAPAPEKLPATASPWPLTGLVGAALVLAGFGLGAARRRRA